MSENQPERRTRSAKLFLKEWRDRRDWTQEVLAEKIGRASSAVSQIENEKQGLRIDTLLLIAEAFEVDPGDLFRHPDEYVPPLSDAQRRILQATAGLPDSAIEAVAPILEQLQQSSKATHQ